MHLDDLMCLTGVMDSSVKKFGEALGYGCNDELTFCSQGPVTVTGGAVTGYPNTITRPDPSAEWRPTGFQPQQTPARTESWGTIGAGGPAAAGITGNWPAYRFNADGNIHSNGSILSNPGDLVVAGAFNRDDQPTLYTITPGGQSQYQPAPLFDANGNLTDDGEKYLFVYDPMGNLTAVKRRNAPNQGTVFAQFTYNALGYRTSAVYDEHAAVDITGNWGSYRFNADGNNRPIVDGWFRPQPIGKSPDLAWRRTQWDPEGRAVLVQNHSLPKFGERMGYGCNNEILFCSQGPGGRRPADTAPGVAAAHNGAQPEITGISRSESWGIPVQEQAGTACNLFPEAVHWTLQRRARRPRFGVSVQRNKGVLHARRTAGICNRS